ncbi:MAG: response regulator, partial [Burkholderiales bacterium]
MQLDRGNCILWVDMRSDAAVDSCADFGDALPICKIYGGTDLPEAISLHHPLFLCFDYDRPDKSGMLALQETKRVYPHLPILMLTEHHSSELEVWALRNRVWDYLVKPLAPRELEHSLQTLMRLCAECR